MNKVLACLLAAILLLGLLPAGAEETEKYDLLTVGITTPFSGNFLSGALGNSISDQDVRRLIHGYQLVYWDSASGAYQFNRRLVTAAAVSEDGLTYTISLEEGLTYNDGTPITAKDYAFSLLLLGSRELQETAGGQEDLSRILGGKAYQDGSAGALEGVRLISDDLFTISIDPDYTPYFYELKMLEIAPLPISAIAPGCEVLDDGQGVYLSGPFSAELLEETLADPDTGYISHPSVTCGAYTLTDYDGTTVSLELNPKYIGNAAGVLPTIPKMILRTEDPDLIMNKLAAGELDLVVRCARADQINSGIQLAAGTDFAMEAYGRSGLSYISFCAEKGPTADLYVRKALLYCMDKDLLAAEYTGAYGTPVDGFYGIGQWMFKMANGTLIPEEGQEAEWADLTLENIPKYSVDVDQASACLDQAGWTMNENGDAYQSGIRYKQEGDKLIPLTVTLLIPEENGAGAHIPAAFDTNLKKAGIGLVTETLPMTELLKLYYHRMERDCDMILLGSNLGDVFDPSGEYDENGTNLISGITDPQQAELAVAMRRTEPGNAPEYCRRWLAWQQHLMDNAAVMPLYSDAYLDFHITELQDYKPGSSGSWAVAVTEAFLGDYVPETESTEDGEFGGEEPDDGDFEEIP